MKRALCVHFPDWATDRVRRRRRDARSTAVLLAEVDAHGRHLVARRDARAAAAGIRVGMTLAHARALVDDPAGLWTEAFAPERDGVALRRLAIWSHRFAPIVALDGDDGLRLDISGCGRLFGGERRLIAAYGSALEGFGFTVRLAAAPTFGAARAIARYATGRHVSIGPEHVREMLDPLPPVALGLDAPTAEALLEVGIERIDELRALPRSTIPARFGDGVLAALDRAFGQAMEWIEPIRPTPPPKVERIFEGPTRRQEAIHLAVREGLDELVTALEQRDAGVERLRLILGRADLDPLSIELGLSRASRNAAHLWSLLRPRVEAAQLGFGVEQISLIATRIRKLKAQTPEAWRGAEAVTDAETTRALGELLDSFVSRLGAERVLRVKTAETHRPERVFRRAAPTAAPSGTSGALTPSPRPSRLLRPPTPLPDVTRDSFVTLIGPERIDDEWWRGDDPDADVDPRRGRDYYRTQDDSGRWFWVARNRSDGRWFLHGEWA